MPSSLFLQEAAGAAGEPSVGSLVPAFARLLCRGRAAHPGHTGLTLLLLLWSQAATASGHGADGAGQHRGGGCFLNSEAQ